MSAPGREYATKKPCVECPFRRDYDPAAMAAKGKAVSGPRLVGQATGPFFLPCHMDPEYQGPGHADPRLAQCAGAAVYRANCGIDVVLPDYFHRLPADRKTVWDRPETLLVNLAGITLEKATRILIDLGALFLFHDEMDRAGPGKVTVVPIAARAGEGREVPLAEFAKMTPAEKEALLDPPT